MSNPRTPPGGQVDPSEGPLGEAQSGEHDNVGTSEAEEQDSAARDESDASDDAVAG